MNWRFGFIVSPKRTKSAIGSGRRDTGQFLFRPWPFGPRCVLVLFVGDAKQWRERVDVNCTNARKGKAAGSLGKRLQMLTFVFSTSAMHKQSEGYRFPTVVFSTPSGALKTLVHFQ